MHPDRRKLCKKSIFVCESPQTLDIKNPLECDSHNNKFKIRLFILLESKIARIFIKKESIFLFFIHKYFSKRVCEIRFQIFYKKHKQESKKHYFLSKKHKKKLLKNSFQKKH